MKRRGRLILTWLLLASVCIAVVFIPSSEPLYDASPHDGDETMSLSQAFNSVRMHTPGYGYNSDGEPWTPGLAVCPVFFAEYGPILSRLKPLDRLPAARRISRVLLGIALFLGVATILRRPRGRRVSGAERALGVAAALGLVLLFCSADTFLLVGSFGRVEASGVLSVAIFGYSVRCFLEDRSERRLLIAGACVAVAIFSSPLAGSICAFDALGVAFFHVVTPFSLRRLGRTIAAGLTAIIGAVAFFLFAHLVVMRGWGGPQEHNLALQGETDLARSRLLHFDPMAIVGQVTSFPGVLAIFVLIVAGSMLVATGSRTKSARRGEAGFGVLFLRLAMVMFGAQFVTARDVYTPLIVCAMIVPFLDAVARTQGAVLQRAIAVLALPFVICEGVPNNFRRTPEQRDKQVLSRQLNVRRDAHIASLLAFFDEEHIGSAFTTDPLFTLVDSDQHRFIMVMTSDLRGAREVETLRRFIQRYGVHYLVTTQLGDDGFVNYIGFQDIRKWTSANRRGAAELTYPDGSVLQIEEVFQSTAPDIPPGREYAFGPPYKASTPFYVYRLQLRP